ncbi:MAG: zf-HC2 domain-containing protein [Rhodobacteraceae bacterium]|nr:zf-HC2 domain-containing protein [Paracoccaceae bacterium]
MVIMDCRSIVTEISDIIDRKASLITRMRFHTHLLMCRNCQRYFEQFKLVKDLTGRVEADDLPQDFDQVMSFVMTEITQQEKGKDV